jgi:predicted RNase H-like nuclease (RuvC/YqgF family)
MCIQKGVAMRTHDMELESEISRLENIVEKQDKLINQLQKQASSLQKQLNKVVSLEQDEDYQSYLVHKAESNDLFKKINFLKKKWSCDKCGRGFLLLKIIPMPNNQKKYFRHCNNCSHKTKFKDYNEKVEGITPDLLKAVDA